MKRMGTLLVFALMLVCSVVLAPVQATSAAPRDGVVMEASALNQVTELETKITEITDQLTAIGRPLAILALVLVFISYIAEPALPDWARENKGMMRKVLFAAIGMGLIPDLVGFAFGS